MRCSSWQRWVVPSNKMETTFGENCYFCQLWVKAGVNMILNHITSAFADKCQLLIAGLQDYWQKEIIMDKDLLKLQKHTTNFTKSDLFTAMLVTGINGLTLQRLYGTIAQQMSSLTQQISTWSFGKSRNEIQEIQSWSSLFFSSFFQFSSYVMTNDPTMRGKYPKVSNHHSKTTLLSPIFMFFSVHELSTRKNNIQ